MPRKRCDILRAENIDEAIAIMRENEEMKVSESRQTASDCEPRQRNAAEEKEGEARIRALSQIPKRETPQAYARNRREGRRRERETRLTLV